MASSQDMLDAVETAIINRQNGGAVQAYSIGGKNIQYMSLTELYAIRDKLKKEVNIASGKTTRTYATFGGF